MSKSRRAIWIVVTCLLSVGWCLVVVRGTRIEAIMKTPAARMAVPRRAVATGEVLLNWDSMRSHALFYATRQIHVPPDPAQLAAQLPLPDYKLAGVLVVPGKPAMATLVQNSTGTVRRVRAGDDLDGWRIREIAARRVMLEHESQRAQLGDAIPTGGSGISAVPLARTVTSQENGVRALGDGRTASMSNGTISQLLAEPRLYRPPSSQTQN